MKPDRNRLQDWIERTLPAIARIGSDPADDDNIRLQKSLLVICSFPFMVAGWAWGLMYYFVRDQDEFVCEPRGTVNVKAKGEMEVWLVKSAK